MRCTSEPFARLASSCHFLSHISVVMCLYLQISKMNNYLTVPAAPPDSPTMARARLASGESNLSLLCHLLLYCYTSIPLHSSVYYKGLQLLALCVFFFLIPVYNSLCLIRIISSRYVALWLYIFLYLSGDCIKIQDICNFINQDTPRHTKMVSMAVIFSTYSKKLDVLSTVLD